MNCYDTAPEFIEEDNRGLRHRNPISKEQMHNKHEVLLPEEVVKGKTILDLGSCLGATGHWCLSHGAAHYTGVEFQTEYVEKSQKILTKYHPGKFAIQQMSIEEWLKQPDKPQFDVVCILGVIYAFIDYFSVLKAATDIAKSTLVIESVYPYIMKKLPTFCGVAFADDQTINLANEPSSFIGRGTRISPKGMEWLMKGFGFESKEGILRPKPIVSAIDIYNRPLELLSESYVVRYMLRFIRSEKVLQSLSEDLQRSNGTKAPW